LSALVVATQTASAGNGLYHWINDRGEPLYSDRPPPKGVNYEVVSIKTQSKRIVSAEEGVVPASVTSTAGNEFEEVSTAPEPIKSPEMCNRAQTNLESLTSSDKVRVRNEQGEVRYLTPEEVAVERKTAREQIEVYCN
jgi:hypothetical protein